MNPQSRTLVVQKIVHYTAPHYNVNILVHSQYSQYGFSAYPTTTATAAATTTDSTAAATTTNSAADSTAAAIRSVQCKSKPKPATASSIQSSRTPTSNPSTATYSTGQPSHFSQCSSTPITNGRQSTCANFEAPQDTKSFVVKPLQTITARFAGIQWKGQEG